MESNFWESPNGMIFKEILTPGTWDFKPTENCLCDFKLTNYNVEELQKYTENYPFVIGNCDGLVETLLSECLVTMHPGEIANVNFKLAGENYCSFMLQLLGFTSDGLICDWNAKKKYNLAIIHKQKGVVLFNAGKFVEASERFGRGMKILCSIPIPVDEVPDEVEELPLNVINDLKLNLYNNLASCFLKVCRHKDVLPICTKIFEIDEKNVKALYKQAMALFGSRSYEEAQRSFLKVLELEPGNKAAQDKLKTVNEEVSRSNAQVKAMFKRMFE